MNEDLLTAQRTPQFPTFHEGLVDKSYGFSTISR
jgi:hypothetical protein